MASAELEQGNLLTQGVYCRKCKWLLQEQDFYKGHIRKDGLSGECKECTKRRVRERARTNPAVQEYDRKRAKLPHRKAKARKVTREWRAKNVDGFKAQTAVGNAIRDGKVEKAPCLFCGREDVHAHHRDYAKPLDVIWLCPKCHHRLHANFPETEGLNKSPEAQP